MSRTLLIVDDIKTNRDILKNLLGDGYIIIEAEDGQSALRVMHHSYAEISAVLLDLVMPIMDGYEVLNQMHSDVTLATLPVIVMTGQSDIDSEERALSLGANDYITKPYQAAIIKQRIQNTINLRETSATVNALQFDQLTGLYSREKFFTLAQRMTSVHEAGYFIMASFDINSFKVINDQYGTEKGDEVLRTIAKVFKNGFDACGGICCRLGSDDFAVLYPASFQESDEIMEIRKKAAIIDGLVSPLIFSIGIYVVNDLSITASSMYDRACLAGSSIKGQYDRTIAFYDESMRELLLSEQKIVNQMEYALSNRQFKVWFQPQYNHSTGALIGSEALVRWRHPENGLISPGIFIPIFEKNGFIYELDKYVWESVCSYLRNWIDEGRSPLPVSVNISRFDIFKPELVSILTGLLAKYDLPVKLLRLEITESAFAQSSHQIEGIVKQLVDKGFTVEIDDFGSGYSSLNTLKSIPAQVVKLDMRFLEGNNDSERGGNIIESIVRMTKWLGMSVIAEGVETKQQADFLKSIGCSYVQGFLYARPMPAPEYEALCNGTLMEEHLLKLETVENLNNNSFWDPNSMDTLIFNSYVGGACIFEYSKGTIELLRINDKYIHTFGDGISSESVYGYNVFDFIDDDNKAIMMRNIENAITSGSEQTCETVTTGLYGIEHPIYIRSTVRAIAKASDRYLLYCMVSNITAQREAEQKRQEIAEELSVIMADIGSGITASTITDGKVKILFSNDKYYEILGYTREQYKKYVSDSFALIHPDDREWVKEKATLAYTNKQPVQIEYRVICGDGIDRWVKASISSTRFSHIDSSVQLCIISDISAEKKAELELKSTYSLLETLMKDTPGGFVRIRVLTDGTFKPIYFNEGFCKLTGMSQDELMTFYANDIFVGVHPEDVGIVKKAIVQMLKNGEANSSRYRHIQKDGSSIWLMIFGRVTRDELGDFFLNIYYTDSTEQVKAEEKQKELLDNLPYGVALYDYDGSTIRAVHLNKRYWELVNRDASENPNMLVLSSVYSEDLSIIQQELSSAIRQSRDLVCDIRILYGQKEYRPFHIVGRIIKKNDDKYAIYTSYTPISDEAMSIQEMLPIALQTVMEMQNDISFVKDKNLRYICGSQELLTLAGLDNEAELIGKTDFEILDKSVAEKYYAADCHIMSTGESIVDWVDVITATDGTEHYYASTSKFPLKDSKGNIIGVYGIGRDITETRTMKSQLELLTNNIPGGIATYEYRDGQLFLTYFNDGFSSLFGLSRNEFETIISNDVYSGIYTEDIPVIDQQLKLLVNEGKQADCAFRVHIGDGGYKWISIKAVPYNSEADKTIIHVVLFDITQSQDALEKLRISEEENRLAIQSSKTVVCRYDVATKTLVTSPSVNFIFEIAPIIEDVPYGEVRQGMISPETALAYTSFYESIMSGKETGEVLYQRTSVAGWRWVQARFATIFSDMGKPVSAVIAFVDKTESFEKDAAYKKWRQSIAAKAPESYSLYRCNINKQTFFDAEEGELISASFKPSRYDFDGRTEEYAAQCIVPEDIERFTAFLNADTLLSGYYQGKLNLSIDYRERQIIGGYRWLRLTVDLVEYMNSSDVEAYLLFEDIDEAKRTEIATIERAETDPLTGLMNRTTFAARVNYLIETSKPNAQHALLMLDVDGFKGVNDFFGHGAGDQTLIDLSEALRSGLRHGDLVGRLGGDEFVVFLADIPGEAIAANKAKQFCALTRKTFSSEVEISASIGISLVSRDGSNFDALYPKADAAMYHVKNSGKNNFAFYNEEMESEHHIVERRTIESLIPQKKIKKRRILIVDDSKMDQAMLTNLFADDFIVEKAKDGVSALIRMRHYGSAISVVLLDLMMPGMSGLDVLTEMQKSDELRTIPVIVVSGDDNRETSLKAIRTGATDFVTKPVDAEILRIRVQSAIGKAENERLRAKNSFLEFQNSEVKRYKTVLERNGIIVIEHDWVTGSFAYDPMISNYIAGNYDDRNFWHILLTDFVTDTMTVKRMQELVHTIAADRQKDGETILVKLKSQSKALHWFRMGIYKLINEHGLTGKIYLSFFDLGEEIPQ